MHGVLHRAALQQEPLYKSPFMRFIWHLLCISNAEPFFTATAQKQICMLERKTLDVSQPTN